MRRTGRVQNEAQTFERLSRHRGERVEIELACIGRDRRLVDRPFEPRDVGKIGKLARRRIRGEEARELATVAIHVAVP